MKILSLGIDNSVCNRNSGTSQRIAEYASLVEEYDIVVPSESNSKVNLSEKAKVFCVGGGTKIKQFFAIYKKAKRLLQNGEYDVMTVQDPFELALIAWFLSKKYKVGLNIQEHGDFFSAKYWRNESLRNFYRYYLGKFLIKRADSVRVVSEKIKNTLTSSLKISENKIVVVPVFTDQSFVEQSVDDDLIEKYKNKFVFLTVGRMVKQKNLGILIRAFARLARVKGDIFLLMVGSGSEKESLVELVENLEIKERVEFLEWVDYGKLYSFFRLADIYVLPSSYEGWGRVIVEALQSRLPVLMTEVGCADELVKNEESGLVVPIADIEKFAFGMEELYNNKSLRGKFIQNSEKALKSLKNKQETLNLYLESWKKAIKN